MSESERTEEDFKKYVQHLMIKVKANFQIEKIIIETLTSLEPYRNKKRPLIIFTDGGKDI